MEGRPSPPDGPGEQRRARDGLDVRVGDGRRAGVGAAALALVAFLIGAPVGKGLGQAPTPADAGEARDATDLTAPRPLPLLDGQPVPALPSQAPRPPAPQAEVQPAPSPSLTGPRAWAERQSYTLQVGAFRTVDAAERLAARLADRGYAAFVVSVDLGPAGQGVWHRVRVGRFSSREAAEAVANRLATAERLAAQVLRETGLFDGVRGVDMPPVGR